MYSSASDMAKWSNIIFYSQLLTDASRQKLLAFTMVGNGLSYGLGIYQMHTDDMQYEAIIGNVPGYSTIVVHSGDIMMSVLCNLSDYSGRQISYAEEIAKKLLIICSKV